MQRLVLRSEPFCRFPLGLGGGGSLIVDESRLRRCERFVLSLLRAVVSTVRVVVPARSCLVKPSRLKLELLIVVVVRLHDLLEDFVRVFATLSDPVTLTDLINRL